MCVSYIIFIVKFVLHKSIKPNQNQKKKKYKTNYICLIVKLNILVLDVTEKFPIFKEPPISNELELGSGN